jgi:N1-acetylpolyamine oxidase
MLPSGRTHVLGGFQGLTAALTKGLKENQVRYNKPASCVVWSPVVPNAPRILTKCADGEEIPSDFVIVTLPLGFLKNNPNFFIPELPLEKREAVERIGFGSINKVFLEFAKPFWVRSEGYIKPAWSVEELQDR